MNCSGSILSHARGGSTDIDDGTTSECLKLHHNDDRRTINLTLTMLALNSIGSTLLWLELHLQRRRLFFFPPRTKDELSPSLLSSAVPFFHFSFSSHILFFPFSSSSYRCRPLNHVRGLGECCKLPYSLGRSHRRQTI